MENLELKKSVQSVELYLKELKEQSIQDGQVAKHTSTIEYAEKLLYQERIFKEIWTTLSSIDVGPYVKLKNNLSYLSWANAVSLVMEHYPVMQYEFLPYKEIVGGTVIVETFVNIHGCTRKMFLPVMTGYKNAAVTNPDARDIGDAYMRCLVKNLAMFGLGIGLYTGEDISPVGPTANPDSEDLANRQMEKAKKINDDVVMTTLTAIIETVDVVEELNKIWVDNSRTINAMSVANKQKLTDAFKNRKSIIVNKK